jgi:hypothetical protein
MSLFSGAKTQATQTTQYSGLQVQSSVAGQCIPLVYGQAKVTCNLIWYGNFQSYNVGSSGSGKGGGSSGKGGSGQTNYSCSFIAALCEGYIYGTGLVWASNNTYASIAEAGLALSGGAIGQLPISWLTPPFNIPYNGVAIVESEAYDLGSSASLPNFNFEVLGPYLNSGAPGIPDANPAYVINDFLTNPFYGAGFPTSFVGNITTYAEYCTAQGLWISPVYDSQDTASSILEDLATATNAAFVWSSGVLTIVPYGDQALAANGATYTPPGPLYSLTDDDFLKDQGQDPVTCQRARPADQINALQLEYLPRGNQYYPDIVQACDEASIAVYGLRQADPTESHFFCDGNAAMISAWLQLARQAVRNTYTFKLDARYCVLDPMDLVEITDPNLGLLAQTVRITEIDEDDQGNLSVTAEDYLYGTGQAALYSFQSGSGFKHNYNAPPTPSSAPVFLEPTFQLTGGDLEVWIAVAGNPNGGDGVNTVGWGGCQIYVSLDGTDYALLETQYGGAVYGTITAALPAYSGTGLDTADTLAVSVAPSYGALPAGSTAQAQANATLCWVGGEFLSFGASTLTGANAYALTALNRNQYGTVSSLQPAATPFVYCEQNIVKLPITADYIGKTVSVKILDFNVYGGALTNIAAVEPYTYTVQGLAYTEPLPAITGLNTTFLSNIQTLVWDAISDPRNPDYEVRTGASWQNSVTLGRVPQPSIAVPYTGTYWVAAHYLAPQGYTVYGAPAEVSVQGATLVRNVLVSYDEAATGWTGTLADTAVTGGVLELSAAGNILAAANVLTVDSVINYGGWNASGSYTIPSGHIIDCGRVVDVQISFALAAYGVSIFDNVLAVDNIFTAEDILGTANNIYIDAYPQVKMAGADGIYGAWQDFTPGAYYGRYFNFKLVLNSTNAQVNCVIEDFSFTVDVPDRDDTGTAVGVPAGGLTVTYTTPFNDNPNVQVTIVNATPGDDAIISAATASGFSLQILNGGSGVARTVNWIAQGY